MDKLLINNLEFAEKQLRSVGKIALKNLPRLSEIINGKNTECDLFFVEYTILGSHLYNLPSLHLQIHGLIPLQCQRCLEPVEHAIELEFDYVLSDVEPSEIVENQDLDWLEIDAAMDLVGLIEDELLIALPIAPMHSFDCKTQKMESGEKINPFAVLKGKF